MVFRSAFYVELSSFWCVVVKMTFQNVRIAIRDHARRCHCQENLKFCQGMVMEMSGNLFLPEYGSPEEEFKNV